MIASEIHPSFGAQADLEAPRPPRYEISCGACLTDFEVATFLLPVAFFVLDEYTKTPSESVLRTLAPAHEFFRYQAYPRTEEQARTMARKLMGVER